MFIGFIFLPACLVLGLSRLPIFMQVHKAFTPSPRVLVQPQKCLVVASSDGEGVDRLVLFSKCLSDVWAGSPSPGSGDGAEPWTKSKTDPKRFLIFFSLEKWS